jgi:ATP-dependent exoDNAse (exonuclease V) alpha subunit
MDILNKEIRLGKVSQKSLNKLNERVSTRILFDDKYQYLTVTNNMADSINKIFLNKLKLKACISEPEIVKYYYWPLPADIKCPLNHTLYIKIGMKVMFVKNDSMKNGFRWVNGTIGKVVGINYDLSKDFIYSVTVETVKGIQEVTRHELPIKYPCGNIFKEIATVKQFPFVAAWAISIDKSQGLTLDKAFIFLEKANRDNQLYVALSRVRVLNDLLLNRELRSSDIHLSKTMQSFNESISDKIIPVYYNEDNHISINITINSANYGFNIIKNSISKKRIVGCNILYLGTVQD